MKLIIKRKKKNQIIGVFWVLLFGPFGLLYCSLKNSAIMIALSLVSMLVPPMVAIMYLACFPVSYMTIIRRNENVAL